MNIMAEMKIGMPQNNDKREGPPPYYEGDKGWSKEREKRRDEIWKIVNRDRWAHREHTKETLDTLRALIEECETAIRSNPDAKEAKTLIEQSKLIQGLLYDWYRATKDRKI